MNAKLCIVEDDPTIRELVAERLRQEGYQVDTFATAEHLFESGKKFHWDLYLLDVLLGGKATGLQLCQTIRAKLPLTPILIVSALSEPSDRIEGLKLGADDYLTKPFEMEELLLRVKGMLKRRGWYTELPQGSTFEWDGNRIDFVNLTAVGKQGATPLTQKECMLMKLLVERRGHVVTREEILDRVWGYNLFPSTRTVDNFIVRLRKIFENTPNQPQYILSVRGVGYKFVGKKQ